MKQSMTVKYSYQNYKKWNNQQKKRCLLFVFNISYSKKTLLVADIKTDFVSGLIVSLIVFNKYIEDITIVIFRIRTIII